MVALEFWQQIKRENRVRSDWPRWWIGDWSSSWCESGHWLDSGLWGEELVGIKEIIPPSSFTRPSRRTILFRIKHQNFAGTLQFFKIDREPPLLLRAGVGEAIWHGRDWQTITGRLYCQQTPTSAARRLCYSGHNANNPTIATKSIIQVGSFPLSADTIPSEPQLFLLQATTSSTNQCVHVSIKMSSNFEKEKSLRTFGPNFTQSH